MNSLMKLTMNTCACTLMMVLAGCLASSAEEKKDVATTAAPKVAAVKDVRIIITTNKGDIEATIYASKVPMTAANYLNLAKRGYYNNLKFHRVIPNFMIQAGVIRIGSGRTLLVADSY